MHKISSSPANTELSFADTSVAFGHKNNPALLKTASLFYFMNQNWLVQLSKVVLDWCFKVGLPVKGLVKATAFAQFCGGESLEESSKRIAQLAKNNIGTILDYSVEGEETEASFDATFDELMHSIDIAAADKNIPFAVFKISGIASVHILTKIQNNEELNSREAASFERVKWRFELLCNKAAMLRTRLFVDAEESWFQDVIDALTLEQMKLHNIGKAYIYNTYQLYRHDVLANLQAHVAQAEKEGYIIGAKLVRGAYMEKERDRAMEMGYPSPIQPDKESTDRDYNLAIDFVLAHSRHTAICLGTHNEYSSAYLAKKLEEASIPKNDQRFYFAQLLGMSDNISFTLAKNGYNVAKYVPYGPVKSVMPYLFRRAQENTSMKGQSSREFSMYKKEIRRRLGI